MKFSEIGNHVWQWFKNFDIKPAKPVIHELWQQVDCARESGDLTKAIFYLKKIIANNNQNYGALYALAKLYIVTGNYIAGYRISKTGIKYYPEHFEFHETLGYLYAMQGNLKSSATAYKRALSLQPNQERVQHFLNGVQQNNTTIAPRSYIMEEFDNYAATFDNSLVNDLNYCAHIELAKFTAEVIGDQSNMEYVLDLGCGTGLLGKSLSENFNINHLLGVDLAPNMLTKAKERNIYKELHHADLLEHLKCSVHSYDMIAATDVFIYIGELNAVFAECYKALKKGSLFGFSVEILKRGTFKLTPTGRYQHSLSYITALSTRLGFSKIYSKAIDLRKEYGNIVPGYLVLLQK